jgi:hypothetical protein
MLAAPVFELRSVSTRVVEVPASTRPPRTPCPGEGLPTALLARVSDGLPHARVTQATRGGRSALMPLGTLDPSGFPWADGHDVVIV